MSGILNVNEGFFNDMGLLLGFISAGCTVMAPGWLQVMQIQMVLSITSSAPPNSLGAFWSTALGLVDRRFCPFQWNKFADIHRI